MLIGMQDRRGGANGWMGGWVDGLQVRGFQVGCKSKAGSSSSVNQLACLAYVLRKEKLYLSAEAGGAHLYLASKTHCGDVLSAALSVPAAPDVPARWSVHKSGCTGGPHIKFIPQVRPPPLPELTLEIDMVYPVLCTYSITTCFIRSKRRLTLTLALTLGNKGRKDEKSE